MGLLDWLRRRTPPFARGAAPAECVRFDDTWVVHHRTDGSLEELAWPDLQSVRIQVSAPGGEGPRQAPPELHWVLVGKASRCEIPFEAEGCEKLYERLLTLSDFNTGAVREAREADPPTELLCWIRGAA